MLAAVAIIGSKTDAFKDLASAGHVGPSAVYPVLGFAPLAAAMNFATSFFSALCADGLEDIMYPPAS